MKMRTATAKKQKGRWSPDCFSNTMVGIERASGFRKRVKDVIQPSSEFETTIAVVVPTPCTWVRIQKTCRRLSTMVEIQNLCHWRRSNCIRIQRTFHQYYLVPEDVSSTPRHERWDPKGAPQTSHQRLARLVRSRRQNLVQPKPGIKTARGLCLKQKRIV